MDKTVPEAAAHLLDFISVHEGPKYTSISSNKESKLPKPVTSYTVDELLADAPTWRKKYGCLSSAAGRYQIITKTLKNLKEVMGLKGSEKFNEDLQDRMGMQLLRFRGYDAFMAGQLTKEQFAKNLAQEWASLPVLAGTKNYTGKNIQRGSSYYAGDGMNSAGVTAASFERALSVNGTKVAKAKTIPVTDALPPIVALSEPEATKDIVSPEMLEANLDVTKTLTASANVKPADSNTVIATKAATIASASVAVVSGAGAAAQSVTDWTPVIGLFSAISTYGPYVAAAIVVGVVLVVIAKKVWGK